MDQSFSSQVRHLYEKVSRVIRNEGMRRTPREAMLKPYERLIEQCSKDYPMLKASQLYERPRSIGLRYLSPGEWLMDLG